MITIQELLYNRGIKPSDKVKLIRHSDKRVDLYDLYKNNKEQFLLYQSQQSENVFKNVDYIVCFLGEEGLLSRFIGVYKILSYRELEDVKISKVNNLEYKDIYEMKEITDFEDLKERVIINWGKAALKWNQWLDRNIKEVIQIQPGLHYKQFKDYFDFILDFNELNEIINNKYPIWKKMLSATNGIYLINDKNTGKLYVGSAYGKEGIWGRWKTYVQTNGTGGNKQLDELITLDNSYAKNFSYSILMLLPSTITSNEAIKKENLFKKKLGTNTFGLNSN
jgi:hypothetical protein